MPCFTSAFVSALFLVYLDFSIRLRQLIYYLFADLPFVFDGIPVQFGFVGAYDFDLEFR